MAKYDPDKMKACGTDIQAELKTYTAAKTEIEDIMTKLRGAWKDSNNDTYTQKYNSEAKEAGDNIETLMRQFSEFLLSAGAGVEKWQDRARQDI